MGSLSVLLAAREHERARMAYSVQLLWTIGAQLYGLSGGEDYPVPDYFTMFPPKRMPGQNMTADQIRRKVLRDLERRRGHGRTV